MADFLSRLAQRSLGTAPVARPVVAPLFGPSPDVAPGRDVAWDDNVGVEAADAVAAADRTIATLPLRAADAARPAPAMEAGAEPPNAATVHLPAGRAPWAAREERPAAAKPDGPGRLADVPATPHARPPGPAARQRLDGAPRERARPRVEAAAPAAPSEAPAPIVRVSIARVEVRAVNPPAIAARPAPRTADRLSLAEYLRPGRGRR